MKPAKLNHVQSMLARPTRSVYCSLLTAYCLRLCGFIFAGAFCLVGMSASAYAQSTYTWNQTGTAAWTTSTNWTPTRTTPATNDVLVFNNGATTTVTAVPTQTVGQLLLSGNSTVNLQAGAAANILTIGGGTGTDLNVPIGSTLNVNGANALNIGVATGATGNVSGSISTSIATETLTAVDASGITFNSLATFTQGGTGTSGNVFGSGTTNSIVFANGSTFIQNAGANPFQKTQPASVVIFQTGSLFKFQQNSAPSFSGRTYANLEINSAIFNQSATGGNPLSIDNLTITLGTLNLNLTGTVNIKGNITVAGSQTLTFTPASATTITLSGSSAQTIGGAGALSFGANASINVTNTSGVSLQKDIALPGGTLTVSNGATLNCGTSIVSGAGTFTLASGGVLSIGDLNGITASACGTGATCGNVRTTARTFDSGGSYTYTGSSAQAVGNGLPSSVLNLTIAATGGATVTGNSGQTVTNLLRVQSGIYSAASVYKDVQIDSGATLSLAGATSVSGNWTDSGTFLPNGNAVTFTGFTSQTIARGSAGTETFSSIIVDKLSNTLNLNNSPATSVNVTGSTGNVLQLINAGNIDLGGNTLTLQNNGGNLLVSGGTRNITSSAAGSLAFTGSKTVISAAGGTLVVDGNAKVALQNAVDFGSSLTTLTGFARLIRNSTGSVSTNPPSYSGISTLVYDVATFGFVARGLEWSATSGPGYPNNVEIDSGSFIDLGAGGPGTAREIGGALFISTGAELSMNATAMTASLTTVGRVDLVGTGVLTLSSLAGGNLFIGGTFRKESTSTFTPNGRTVTFNGTGTQDINGVSGTVAFDGFAINKTSGLVDLLTDVSVNPGAAASIEFNGGAGDILDLNSKTFTINSGGIGGSNTAGGFKGNGFSSMVLNGTGAVGTLRFTSGNESLANLTMNRTSNGSVTLGTPLTINGASNSLTLTNGIINTGAYTLTMGSSATSNGSSASYVNGTMKKIYLAGAQSFTFDLGTVGGTTDGYTPAAVDSLPTSAAGDVTATVVNAFANFTDTTKAVRRYWSLTNNGLTLVNLSFIYLDGDVPGTANEAIFVPYKIDGPTSTMPTGAVNAGTNTITVPGATSFSDWTAAEPNVPTAVKLTKFKAVSYADGVQLNWESGYEVNNLGYYLYREQNGKRTRVTPAVVAGSALTVGQGNRLTAGYSYSWFDSKGTADTSYYLESIDLNGQRQTFGPIYAFAGATNLSSPRQQRAMLLSDLAKFAREKNETGNTLDSSSSSSIWSNTLGWPSSMKGVANLWLPNASLSSASLAVQQRIAAGKAVKLEVRGSGWYRVSQQELVAAGLEPATDARLLQLYVDGEEIPIALNNNGARLSANDALEFYGVALDTPTTDTRTYWLIAGNSAGKRIVPKRGKPRDFYQTVGMENVLRSFDYTTERREKLLYASHLLNGDTDNILGAPVLSEPVQQTIAIRNLDRDSSSQPQLVIALQGLTAQGHEVRVQLNGVDVGTMSFIAGEHYVSHFNIRRELLREGDNAVTLAATNGDSDISLIDSIRLTYAHAYRADNNALRFSLPPGQLVRVNGFTSSNIRVIDITNPASPFEVAANVSPATGGYSVTIPAASNDARTLMAFADELAGHPALVVANKPSSWNARTNGADMIIITHKDFREAIEPLANLRRSQGMSVAVVDVEDVYDEFSYGAHTPFAIRSFLMSAAGNWARKPGYLLLVGDSSWDPRNYLDQGDNDFVPTKLIDTSYMETGSDDWLADFTGEGQPQLSLGRLPGRTANEISLMVSKILTYEQQRELNLPLRGAVLVADNGFESRSSQTQSLLPSGVAVQTINRAEIGNDDLMRGQIVDALNQGPMIVNYYGHGSVSVWTSAGLLDSELADTLTNANKPSVFVMMTCLNGYSQDAFTDSLSESILKAPGGGAVAVWASSGFTDSNPQFLMNSQFYRLLFGVQPQTLGDAARGAKAATSNQDVRRTWILFGDPTMRLR
jgi:hypothetical protein